MNDKELKQLYDIFWGSNNLNQHHKIDDKQILIMTNLIRRYPLIGTFLLAAIKEGVDSQIVLVTPPKVKRKITHAIMVRLPNKEFNKMGTVSKLTKKRRRFYDIVKPILQEVIDGKRKAVVHSHSEPSIKLDEKKQ